MIRVLILDNLMKEQAIELVSKEFPSPRMMDSVSFNDHVFSVGAMDGEKLVGHIFVHEGYSYLTEEHFYTLEYIVVDSSYRGKGISKMLFQEVHRLALERGISYITLTSRKERTIARKLYLQLGYSLKDTGIFSKRIKD